MSLDYLATRRHAGHVCLRTIRHGPVAQLQPVRSYRRSVLRFSYEIDPRFLFAAPRGSSCATLDSCFEVRPADVDETRLPHEAAQDYVRRVAQAKAHTIAEQARAAGEHAIVIAADTTVLAEGEILEKPKDAEDARRMLRLFSGKTHEVLTALCVINVPDGEGIAPRGKNPRRIPENVGTRKSKATFRPASHSIRLAPTAFKASPEDLPRASKAAISTCWACRSRASGPRCKRSAGKKTARLSYRGARKENGGPANRNRRQETS